MQGLNDEQLKFRLENILDIRKFEIELYWKRATYFWAFIGVAFTVYGLTIDKPGTSKVQFIALCVGLLFSVAFYMVNKASKFWQGNWERHTDFSESRVMGRLYKITLPASPFRDIFNPRKDYSASVSRINIYISFFLVILWALLLLFFCIEKLEFRWEISGSSFFYTVMLLFTLFSVWFILCNTTSEIEGGDAKFVVRPDQ